MSAQGTDIVRFVSLDTGARFSGEGVTALNCSVAVSGSATISGILQFLTQGSGGGATIQIWGALHVVSGGVFNWCGGSLTVLDENEPGQVAIDSGGLLNIINDRNKMDLAGLDLYNDGTVDWTNSGKLFAHQSPRLPPPMFFRDSADVSIPSRFYHLR